MADVFADILLEKRERQDWQDHYDFGPGRIIDLEINLEKIYE
jgi:hypothetical protein